MKTTGRIADNARLTAEHRPNTDNVQCRGGQHRCSGHLSKSLKRARANEILGVQVAPRSLQDLSKPVGRMTHDGQCGARNRGGGSDELMNAMSGQELQIPLLSRAARRKVQSIASAERASPISLIC